MTDRLKTVYRLKLCFCGGYKQVFSIARTMSMKGNKFVFLVLGHFLFLLCLKKFLSGSHVLHFCLIRYKSVTRTVISVNRPLIIQ